MTVSLLVNFNDGDGWIDASALVRACPRTERACSENFTHAVNQCNLTLKYDSLFLSKLAVARGDVDVVIETDSEPYFTGRIPPSAQFESSGANVAGDPDVADLEIEVLDYSARLDCEITEDDDVAWEAQAVCDPAAVGASLVHRLLALCGLSGAALNITDTIPTVLDAFALSSGTVGQALDTLLMEYGYAYRFNRAAQLELLQTIIETPTPTVDLDENLIMSSLKSERIEREFDAAKVTWFSFHSKGQALVYLADLPMGDNNRYSGYAIQPAFLWPPEANVDETWFDYQDSALSSKVENGAVSKNKDFSQIVLTKNHSVDESFEFGIIRETSIFKNKRARLTYHNLDGASKLLYWCGIYADVIYLGAENEVRKDVIIDPKRIDTYPSAYIHDAASAARLACARADRYQKAAWRFTFKAQAEIAPGTIGALSDPYSGLEGVVMVIECQTDLDTGIYSMKAISIAPVIVDPSSTATILVPTTPKTKEESLPGQIQNLPTFQDLDHGYVATSGGTKTPTAPTISVCKPFGAKAILLKWDRQLDLTNFDHYEVQVSDDDLVWYSLEFDGSDWKDTVDQATHWTTEMLAHPEIPNLGNADDPVGRTLYYRLRRVTKAAITSAWSASASATTKVIGAGDLAANAILANNISTSEFEAVFAKIDGQLIIGATYDITGVPVAGDQKLVLDGNELAAWEYTGLAAPDDWMLLFKVGGDGALKRYLQAKGLIRTGADLSAFEIGDVLPAGFKRWKFDADYLDELGADIWDTKQNLQIVADSEMPRGHELGPTSAVSTGYVQDLNDYVWTPGDTIAVDFYVRIPAGLNTTGLAIISCFTSKNSFYVDALSTGTLDVGIVKNMFSSHLEITIGAAGGVYHVSAGWHADTDKLYLVVNDISEQSGAAIGGAFASEGNAPMCVAVGLTEATHKFGIADLIISRTTILGASITDSINKAIAHYLNSGPWAYGIDPDNDLFFAAKGTGKIRFYSPTTIVPAGVVWEFAGSVAPDGFLMCDGSSKLRSAYPGLFQTIGTTFGAADGTHFNLPDHREAAGVGIGHNTVAAIADHDEYALGQFKDDQFEIHGHRITNGNADQSGGTAGGYRAGTANDDGKVKVPIKDATTTTLRTGTVTRGKRLGMNFIIKT